MTTIGQPLDAALQELIGIPLVSVDFVEDYVQLVWENSCLTANTMPLVITEGAEWRGSSSEYRHALFALEGKHLTRVEVIEGEVLTMSFNSGALLAISLRDEDYVTAEALLYRGENGQLWVV